MLSFRESDAVIVRRTLEGHPEAFEPLVFRYQKKAHAVAHALGLKRAEVDDAVQEAFLQAFRDLPALREPASFGHWFLKIVRHVSLKLLRRPEAGPGTAVSGDPPTSSEEPLERRDFSEYLWRKVAELPEGIREAIFLYYYEGESVRAVARVLGITGSTVKKRLRTGREQLRGKLWGELEECLRDMIPSARDWQKRGRRLGLLILGSIPASWTSQAGAVAHSGSGNGLSFLARRTSDLVQGVGRGGRLAGRNHLAGWAALGLLLVILGSVVRLIVPGGRDAGGEVARARPDVPAASNPEVALATPEASQAPARREAHGGEEMIVSATEEPPSEEPPPGDSYGSVLVRVIWGDDHTPAAGIRGMVIPWGSPYLYSDERVFTTGFDGTCLVDQVFRGGATVMLDRGGSVGVGIEPGEAREALVEVPPGIDVEGVVVEQQGFPVGGARVWISYGGHTNWGNQVATTLPDGSFSVRSVTSECYIGARAAGHAASDLKFLKGEPASRLEVRIRLNGEGGAVAGIVRDPHGEPIPLANVMVGAEYSQYTLLEDGATGLSAAPFRGFTDSEGVFLADSLAAGKARIAVRALGFVPFEEPVEIQPGTTVDVDVALRQGATLTGKVSGRGGQPATGSKVVIGDWRDFLALKVFSTHDGFYRLRGLPPGEVEVFAERAGWGKASTKLAVEGNETLRWDPVLAQDLEIVGRVLDENGVPLPGFQVMTEEMAQGGRRKATQKRHEADEAGRFRIPDLSDLPYRILVYEPESPFPCFFTDHIRPAASEVVVEVESESLSSAFFLGQVVDPAGNPAGGVKVLCFSGISGYRVYFTHKERGDFQIGPVPPCHYRIEVQAQGYPPVEKEEKNVSANEMRDLGVIWLELR